jgi:hypothetical protein
MTVSSTSSGLNQRRHGLGATEIDGKHDRRRGVDLVERIAEPGRHMLGAGDGGTDDDT